VSRQISRKHLQSTAFFLFVAGTACGWLASVGDASAAAPDAAERAKFLMTGLRDHRERLRKGVVRVTGQKYEKSYRQEPLNGAVKQFYAFDYDAHLLRYEREEVRRSYIATDPVNQTTPVFGKTPTVDLISNRIYFRRAGMSVQYSTWSTGGANEVDICPEDQDRPVISAFDVRLAGMLYLMSYERQDSFEEIFESYNKHPADEVTDEGSGVYRIQWTIDTGGPFPNHRRTLWIDRPKGFSPIRLEVRDHGYSVPPTEPWGDPYCTNEATWTEIAGVWVPETFRIYGGPDDPDKDPLHRYAQRYEHTFEWESVNEPPPDKYFDVDSLNLPKGCMVVDWRGQRPIVERVVGEPNSQSVGELGTATRAAPSPQKPFWRNWLFLSNTAVMVVVLILLAMKRARWRSRA
jgi:hypothetical protein